MTSSNNPHNLRVGQNLFVTYNQRYKGANKHIAIKAVGRKWATLADDSRLCLTTLKLDGGQYSSPGL